MMFTMLVAFVPAGAQEAAADGWDLAVDAANETVSASIEYASGAAVVVQCRGGMLVTAIARTPLSNSASRRAVLTRGDQFSPNVEWETVAGGMAISMDPSVVRFLRRGGPVILQSTEDDPAPFSAPFELPVSGAAVDQVLTSCGAPLTRDHDAAPSATGFLLATPRVEMPSAAILPSGAPQTIYLSCLIRSSRLADCLSEYEQPRNPRAGAATAESADGTRVRVTDRVVVEGRRIEIVVTGARTRR